MAFVQGRTEKVVWDGPLLKGGGEYGEKIVFLVKAISKIPTMGGWGRGTPMPPFFSPEIVRDA